MLEIERKRFGKNIHIILTFTYNDERLDVSDDRLLCTEKTNQKGLSLAYPVRFRYESFYVWRSVRGFVFFFSYGREGKRNAKMNEEIICGKTLVTKNKNVANGAPAYP